MTGQTFTAHPKIDPATGNMVAIGYAASGLCTDDVSYYEVNPAGELVREKWFKVPYYCMMHDFGVHRGLPRAAHRPLDRFVGALEQGKPHFGFDTTLPVYLGVIPRRDDLKQEDIRWFKRDNCFASHVLNAWQDGDQGSTS
jgi:carotenoid cleavage dioxygenase